ncbi:hypothetical protein [Shouchella shacheensis]|uniref:hypothetical protein n=1 Tax=Shouchella shacheensis TaxID=1649580 RepID=UPI0009EB9810|nr:hypothetical protein [Shouchella shacheensis]
MIIFIMIFGIFILFIINSMIDSLCVKRDIPSEKQPTLFRFMNICTTLLLTTSYVNYVHF